MAIPKQKLRQFASEVLNGNDPTKSVKKVFDEKNNNYASVKGHRLIRNDKVIEFLESKAEKAAIRVVDLSEQEENLPVALNASKDILDRAGFKPIEKSQSVNLNLNTELKNSKQSRDLIDEYEEKIRNMLKKPKSEAQN